MDGRVGKLRAEFEKSLKQTAELAAELQRAERRTTAIPRYIEIEEAAHEAGQRLSRRIQACSIGEVAAGAALHAACPGCGRLCRLSLQKRRLQSTDGPVEVLEPVGSCNRCRRSFFPSAQGPGLE